MAIPSTSRRCASSRGRAGAASFGTAGEGGMVVTGDERIASLARQLRGHAFSADRHFWHEHVGFNYRMTNLQAAIGLAQTERLVTLVEARRLNAQRYSSALAGVPGLILPIERADSKNVFWMFALLVQDDFGCTRDELRNALAARGIETRTMFVPIHLQPIYNRALPGESYPVAEELCRRGLYLPSGPALRGEDVAYVAGEIARVREGVLVA